MLYILPVGSKETKNPSDYFTYYGVEADIASIGGSQHPPFITTNDDECIKCR